MTVRLPLSRFQAIFLFFTFFFIPLVFMAQFPKFFSYRHQIKFPFVSRTHQWRSDCLFAGFWLFLYFFTFFFISLVFMVRFSNFFQLYISKLNFPSFEENNNDGQTPFLQVFGYFYIFLHFPPYLWCLWTNFQNFFS